jgi:hypothetical protein
MEGWTMITECIFREAALDFLIPADDLDISAKDKRVIADRFAEFIKSIPAADMRPMIRGEWWPAKDGYYGHVMCSACHKIESHKTDFCPNCGADMKEVILNNQ